MIIDLNQTLYVVDEQTNHHRIVSINIREKTIKCEDGTEYEYSTAPITVVIGDYTE